MDRNWRIAALVAAVLFVYGQTTGFGFINYDDDAYVTANLFVLQGLRFDSIGWALSTVSRFYWHPATWLSLMADVQFFGVSAGAMHVVNFLLHALAAVLVYRFLHNLTAHEGRSFTVAALFAVHPLRVESVAWIAERKDVLSAALMAATLYAYKRYIRRPSRDRYAILLGLFIAACMAKPMAVIVPVLLLIVDYWPLRRRAWLEKAPFFAVAAAIAAVTYIGQREMGALDSGPSVGFGIRLQNAVWSLGEYLRQTVVPTDFSIIYPYPGSFPGVALIAAGLAILTGLAVWQHQARPWFLAGWLWFVLGLVPTLGFIQAGVQARADRFTYIPHIGLLIIIVWAAAEFLPRRAHQVTAAAAIAILAILSYRQAARWQSSETIFAQALENTSTNWLAEHKYGMALLERNEYARAEEHLRRAASLNEADPFSRFHLGRFMAQARRTGEAEQLFAETIRIKPDYADAHYARAAMLASLGRTAEALQGFDRARQIGMAPEWQFHSYMQSGVLLAQAGRLAEAEQHFRSALALQPGSAEARRNLAQAQQALRPAASTPHP